MAVESIIVNIVSNIKSIAKDTDNATKSLGFFKGTIKGIGTALKAAGIGLLLGIMAKFFELLSKNQKVIDSFNTTMNAVNIAFSDLFNFIGDNIGTVTGYFKEIFENPVQKIKDFGNAIWDNLVERFNSLLDTFGHVGKALGHLFEGEFKKAWESAKDASKEAVDMFTGVDNTFDKMKETAIKVSGAIADYTKKTWEAAEATTALDKAVASSAATLDGINKLFAKNALEQQKIIDEENFSFEKRHEALNELTRLTKENNKANLEAAALRVKQAQDLVNLNDSEANKIALMIEENALMDVQAQKLATKDELHAQRVVLLAKEEEIKDENDAIERQRIQDLEDFKIASDKAVAKSKQQMATAVGAAIGALGDLMKEGSAAAKAAALTEIAINTGIGFVQGLNIAQKSAKATGPAAVYAFPLFYAAQVLAVLSAAAQAKQILGAGGGGGGGGGGGAAAAPQPPAPEMMSGAFQLEGGEAVEPARAYVVSDDITNNQNKLAIIRRRATI